MNPVGGRGLGMAWGRGGGFGMGMAWRRGRGGGFGGARFAARFPGPAYYAPPSREQELDMLRDQADLLKDQLDAITQRIGELDQQKS
jgi:hypothetical protein